ncbi:response regulator transcription factor [Pseudonocardia oroxyli]|uniref:DNA-binding response regulator, NarL/FixJ family, contains REC and HTH domains n=1 Tax=Pseudonocardia oroxyli TaxID=366584 RepID=A0A1G7SXN3_PSEOR|nr:response regulator transcription factor [Pseudonocardia oroxyli]SDG27751.1 DNA-binding response regulator, NarL/FixJ family, contains REC and HTH domains [Pseudonocardia oroxyli]
MAERRVRVVLAEDSFLVREGVRRLLDTDPAVELVDACGDLPSLMAAVDRAQPQVVVTDIRMPPGDTDEGIRAAELFRSTRPGLGVVVLSQHDEPEYALKLLSGGSAGRAYLLKDSLADPAPLLSAVHEVALGGSFIDPRVVDALVTARSRRRGGPTEQLTARERDVLSVMAQGWSNESVADRLGLSVRMIEKHINSIFAKLRLAGSTDVSRRVKAVLIYLSETGD